MTWVLVLVAVPLAAAVLGLAIGHRGRDRLAQAVAVLGAAATLGVAGVALLRVLEDGSSVDLWATAATGWVPITLSTRADPLGLTVAVAVGVVALAVQAYSTTYLRGDPRYPSYAALVSLFTAAMLLVVVADDLFVLLVGWEVMGICSYFLIGHHHERPEARAAAVKAFVVTRIGDVGLLFGIFVLGDLVGSFRLSTLDEGVPAGTTLTVGTLLVLAGVVGKSAQFPLHGWLPDAMAGPTPVSALIHAATMVAAGVFLVARLEGVLAQAPVTLGVLAVLASITMVGAGLAALAQDDLKRVLAYSTTGSLALMLGALAVGGFAAGMYYLLAHAAFKALLFLCAGSISHATGSSMFASMGGLRDRMPLTTACYGIGLLCLAGIPPLSGFFGKEGIVHAAEQAALHGEGAAPSWAGWVVLVAALLSVLLTGAYATRAWLLAVAGPPGRSAAALALHPPHEPPWAMRGVLPLLAATAIALGALALSPTWVSRLLYGGTGVPPDGDLVPAVGTTVLSLALTALAAFVTWQEWQRLGRRDPAVVLGRARPAFAAAFGVDAVYDAVLLRPSYAIARAVVAGDRDVVHGYVRGAGRLATWVGQGARRAQSGRMQVYAGAALAVAVVLLATGLVVT